MRQRFVDCYNYATNEQADMAGFALVTWEADGTAIATYSIDDVISPIPVRLMPSYVHDRMLEEVFAHRACEVANDVIDERSLE